MTGAAEAFTVALARASVKGRRHLRGLTSHDRDDVIGAAILWCWENRATYDLAVPLEDWVAGAMRNARRKFERGEAREASTQVEHLVSQDDPVKQAETAEAARKLILALGPENHQLALLRAEGFTVGEIAAKTGDSPRDIARRLKGFKRLRHLLPDAREIRSVIVAAAAPSSDSVFHEARSWIDREIHKLEFAPPLGTKDCPPCWRCKWFEGWTPGKGYNPKHRKIADAEVRAAVVSTEAEKIRIAKEVSP